MQLSILMKMANKPQRKLKEDVNTGADQWLVSYPKYKKGGAVAKEIKEACTNGSNNNK